MKKRSTSIFPKAAAMLLVMLFMMTAQTAWAQGGTYEISSYAGLKNFAATVNSGTTNVCAILTADIVCTDNKIGRAHV